MNKNNNTYEEPQCQVIEVKVQQVIATSGIAPSSNPWENNNETDW